MTPIVKNLFVRFGDSHQLFFRIRERVYNETTGTYEPGPYRDLTGWTVLCQVRTTHDAPDPLYVYDTTLGDQADLVSGRGSVLLTATAATTGALRTVDPRPEEAVYDIQLTTPSGEVYTYIEGAITFKKDVSRV